MPVKVDLQPANFTNRILHSLPADTLQRLQLRKVALPVGREIEFPNNTIDHLFFPETGVAMMTTTFEDGSQVEVGLFGYESVLGISGLMGTKRSLNRVYVLIAGEGFIAPMATAQQEFRRCNDFQNLTFRNVQAGLAQVAQTAGCNAKHDVQQRLASWLLRCADRAQSETLPVSQEVLATMLGVRRMSTNLAVTAFKELGLIDHRRGFVELLDRKRIEQKACECYRVVRQHLEDDREFDSGQHS